MATNGEWKILLIDDEADILAVTGLLLEDAGYRVLTAENGEAGLKCCERFGPQIVVTDVRMPGIDGLEVLEKVKERYPDTEVIVATAFGEMALAIRALRLDASDFITKPIHNDALLVALERARQRYTNSKKLQDYTRFLEEGWDEATRELLETFAYQKNLIAGSMDGIVGCDAKDTVVTFNPSMEKLLGYKPNEVVGTKSMEHFFPKDGINAFKRDLDADGYGGPGRLLVYETALVDRSGNLVPVQISATALGKAQRSDGLVCFVRDLKEIRRLEARMADQARILHQDKMMSLGRLAASVVHEINNPLAGVLNYSRLMARILARGPLAGEQQEKFTRYLDLVAKETDRCSRIVSNLLAFSRKSPISREKADLTQIIQRAVLLSRHKLELENIDLTLEVDGGLPAIEADVNQLQQCLINLIFNAVDAMPDGGKLTIAAHGRSPSGRVEIVMQDTGTGIAPADLPHIFEPFFTTKKEGFGVGLGLSTTYGIIEHHGGSIKAHSQEGRGTRFTISLPIHGEGGKVGKEAAIHGSDAS
jgi:PAS domain S-box-containing protein